MHTKNDIIDPNPVTATRMPTPAAPRANAVLILAWQACNALLVVFDDFIFSAFDRLVF